MIFEQGVHRRRFDMKACKLSTNKRGGGRKQEVLFRLQQQQQHQQQQQTHLPPSCLDLSSRERVQKRLKMIF